MNDKRKNIGAQKQKERQAARATVAGLAGKEIRKLSNSQQAELLTAICQQLGIADQNGIINGSDKG